MNVTIIGAGLAGLSCGIHLQRRGFKVKILEKHPTPGGRARVWKQSGFCLDMGPTLVLMPEVLQNLFRDAGRRCADYLTLNKLDPGYRIFFADGMRFDMTDDLVKLVQQVKTLRPDGEEDFFEYLKDVQDKFVYSKGTFIERVFESFWDIVSLRSIKSFLKIKPFGDAYHHALSRLKDERLALIFSCQNLYLGQSPLKTPSLYNLLAYIEFTYGIWYPTGGIQTIPNALERLFKELGGIVQYESNVSSLVIEDKRVRGVRLDDGSVELSDAVISNRDLPASFMNFVPSQSRPSVSDKRIRSWHVGSSCVLFYLGLRKKMPRLEHHNIFLSPDNLTSLREIFEKKILPAYPLLYVCCPSRTDASLAPDGKEAVYILALAPNLQSTVDWANELPDFRRRVFEQMERHGASIDPSDIEVERVFSPMDFESDYGTFLGNAFGLAPDFFQSACFRPMTKSKDLKGLYHVGASTHPGGGIPMVLTCGKLVAEQVTKDYGVPQAVPSTPAKLLHQEAAK